MPRPNPYEDLFGEPAAVQPLTTITVPNVQPIITNTDYRVAIIGEAPGNDEIAQRTPFVGASGYELNKYLSKVGILRDACYIGNVCRHQPPSNKIAAFDWDGIQIQNGLSTLSNELSTYKPHLCWLLGGSALHAFKEGIHSVPKKRKSKDGLAFAFPNSIGDWRGSLFLSSNDSPYPNCKCVASYHPAAALRNYEWMPLILLDLLFKVWPQSKTPILTLPKRDLRVRLSYNETLAELRNIQLNKPLTSVDIEGGVGTMSCLSLATSPSLSFIVLFTTPNGKSLWSLDEEVKLFQELIKVLGDPAIPKVLQNSLYDRFVLHYSYGIIIRGVVDDTMLKHWELYCELEKSLGFQCSLYTDEPYYKSDRHSDDKETFWEYCCRDSATTHEINGKLTKWLHGGALAHYKFNVDLLNPLLYMELRGIRYDTTLAKQRKEQVDVKICELQTNLDAITGHGLPPNLTKAELLKLVQDKICYKRDPTQPKAGSEKHHAACLRVLLSPTPLTPQEKGYLSTTLGLSLNTKSLTFKTYLYETLNLPPQIDPKTKAQTTDYLALITLTKKATTNLQKKVLDLAIALGELRTRSQMLSIHADKDGRIRAAYNIVGTETSRITCYTSPTGSGYNLQTIPEENTLRKESDLLHNGMRDLFIADEGCYLFKCDLSGADGWTIGAHLVTLGRPAMLDDLKAKIKPAARICYMLRHGTDSLKGKSRDEVKELLKEIKSSDSDYFYCKQGIWGITYLMGPDKLAEVILAGSEGKVSLSRDDVRAFRNAVYSCYEPNIWHDAVGRKLKSQPYPPSLTSASGHTRKFFGRPTEILGQALANEPQENTTYAVKRALYNLWNDPENRMSNLSCSSNPLFDETRPTATSNIPRPSGDYSNQPGLDRNMRKGLRIEPLHTVHDSLDGQFKQTDTAWAITKIKSYFANPLVIAGQTITIPFSGAYGTNWSMDDKAKVGEI